MKRKIKSSLSLLLGIVMVFTMLAGTLLAVPAAAADTADPKKIDKVIVNMRSQDAMNEKIMLWEKAPTASEPDPYTTGRIDFPAGKSAMQLVYSANDRQPDYRAMLHFTKKGIVTEEHKYLVIVYDVKVSKPYRFTIWNSPAAGPEVVISEGNSIDTDGFVISKPIDISTTNEKGSILQRWTGTNVNTLGLETEDTTAEVYIKEFGFFKSAEDAAAYYSAVDLNKDPSIYDANSEYVDPATLPDPVFMRFHKTIIETIQNGVGFFTNSAGEQGKYETVQMDGQYVLKLNYAPSDKWEDYRVMPKFTIAGSITEHHKYMRIVYKTNDTSANKITLYNNSGTGYYTLVDNTAESGGEWVASKLIDISTSQIIERFMGARHCTLEYTSTDPNSEIYIKEIGFFTSLEQASEYYGDEVSVYNSLTFGIDGNAGFFSGDNYGIYTVNENDSTLDITYAESTNIKPYHYMAKVKFNNASDISASYKYARIYYSADVPEGDTNVALYLSNDAGGSNVAMEKNVTDTDGFVLTKTVVLPTDVMERLSGTGSYTKPMHCSITIGGEGTDGLYRIKSIYFFPTREAADSFSIEKKISTVTVNGVDISNYRIVIAEDPATPVLNAASTFSGYVKELTGVELPVVTDDTAETAYEILIGKSRRAKSTERIDALMANGYDVTKYIGCVDGNTVVITAELAANSVDAANSFARNFLYMGIKNPEIIALKDGIYCENSSNNMKPFTEWRPVTNVSDPDVITDDFSNDDGTWTEESGASDWTIAGGVMSTTTDDLALTYIHVYEQNAEISSKLSYTNAGDDADFGLMLRYTADDAWIKAGYDAANSEWYISERQGIDFYTEHLASAKASLTAGKQYNVTFKVDGDTAILTVDGTVVLTAAVAHITPGRVGVYAEDTALTVDDVSLTLLSGQGTVIKNIVHTKLPNDVYFEGGTVHKMNDGSLMYQHDKSIAYKSLDDGRTWEKSDAWFDSENSYINVIRLLNGDFLMISAKTENGVKYVYSKTSSDEGKTWVEGGKICVTPYPGSTASAGNMNDKLMQTAGGRIFYGQNYQVQGNSFFNGRYVFGEVYYSDDNGATWTKSETDSWEIPGNESAAYFGESKLLECADGTIRLYNSWNDYGCIVYSESTDGGKTFGPLVLMPEFECARSSMQFVRDPYAENDTTYYMVWVNSQTHSTNSGMTRGGLSLAKTTDGKNWVYLGDIWRWHSAYYAPNTLAMINQVVDPFVQVTETTVIVGSGISEQLAKSGDHSYHQAQRQHIWTIDKASLEGSSVNRFTDISLGAPYYDAITFVSNEKLFQGTSETTFAPDTVMDRKMFVTVLGRLEGIDSNAYTGVSFTDVKAGSWYAPYVEWAAKNDVVQGVGNGLYGIDGPITVEAACLILMRYADKSADVQTGVVTSNFPDASSISSWALEAVEWALSSGIYDGQNGSLNPTAAASRATVAEMFYNYVNVFGK